MKPLLVVMGVSGSGKSTIGELLATELGIPFEDADTLHSPANVAKMASGHPLTDEDRWPWLRVVGESLHAAQTTGLVVACSALKRAYRDVLLSNSPHTRFVFLEGSQEVLEKRLEHRRNHFMHANMLESQFAALEPLGPDEQGITVDIDRTPRDIVTDILAKLAPL